ncbi:MAG: YkgJ family cysteine cluster protein [Phycisphaerae bacterium]
MGGVLCEHCTGVCCKYIALPIDTPDDEDEFEDVRWYLLHEGVSVFVEEGDWYINIVTHCRHLQPDNRCGIYETRPRICRAYTTDNCDYHSGDYGWEEHFTCAEHLDEYRSRMKIEARAKKRAKGDKKKRRGVKVDLKRAARRRARNLEALTAVTFSPERDMYGVSLPILNGRA